VDPRTAEGGKELIDVLHKVVKRHGSGSKKCPNKYNSLSVLYSCVLLVL
jgi:hypothetical protein